MRTTIDIHKIRYLNLFEKITKIRVKDCFFYSGSIYFAVPQNLVFRAIGNNSENLKKLNHILGKKIRIIAFPNRIKEAPMFISKIISPLELKNISIGENEIVIEAGSREVKALLLGRDKKKLQELEVIVKSFFGCQLRVL